MSFTGRRNPEIMLKNVLNLDKFECFELQKLRFIQGEERKIKKNGQHKITALFLVVTQRVAVISYRRFGTTYRSRR